jgi:hypothetical protein
MVQWVAEEPIVFGIKVIGQLDRVMLAGMVWTITRSEKHNYL